MHMWAPHTKTETNRREQQTGILILILRLSLTVNHSSVLAPSCHPSLQSCVDIRLVQEGSAQLIAGPLRVGGGVLSGETWVGGGECVCVCV